MREHVADFRVIEDLGYSASGAGEHDLLVITKRDLNTHDVARMLARHAAVRQVDVGYAGLKDRRAETTQAFSVRLAGSASPDWAALETDRLRIESVGRHDRKIRRGSLRGNRFELTLRQLSGNLELVERQLDQVRQHGVPNYFGSQRFGRNGSNLERATALFAGELRRPKREQLGMLLSAARSQLFNRVLAERVRDQSWRFGMDGDVMLLDGTQRQFAAEHIDASLAQRLAELDIHPSGPLCGRPGRSLSPGDVVAAIESGALSDEQSQSWIRGLASHRLDEDRRSLRLPVRDLTFDIDGDRLRINFHLPAGAYATSVVREVVDTAG